MTDNVAITPGTGATVATDDVGGVHYQITKLAYGALDTATLVATGAGLPVTVQGTVPVSGTFYPATQPVSGTVAVTGAYQATQPVSIATMPSTPVTGTFWQATQPVSLASTTITGSVAVTGTFWQATQPISGTVTVGNASLAVTGTFFQATQPVSIAATVAVSGPVTDAQIRATALPVSLTSTTITGTVAATQSGAWNVTNISGTVSLPTGASTSALQTTGNSSLSSIDGKTPALGQALAAASVPVVLTAAQITTLTPPAAITGFSTETTLAALNTKVTAVNTGAVVVSSSALPTGASTSALQTTGNSSLSSIDGKITAVNTGAVTISAALPTGANVIGGVTVADVTASGTLTAAAQTVVLTVTGGMSAVSAQITGTWVGTITFEGTVDGTNWVAVNGIYAGTSTPGSTITANGIIRLTPSGLTSLRFNMTAFTSGSAVITMRGGRGTGGTFLNQSLTAGTNILGKVGIDQTTPGTTNAVVVTANSLVSTANSTTANLGVSAVFTGTSEDISEYSTIMVSVFSSHASATDGLSMQQSMDGTNWDLTDVYTIPAATGKTFNVAVNAKFYRLVYTNGATLTTSLRIQTLYSKAVKRSSSVRPQDARTNDNDFDEVAAYAFGFNGTTWDRQRIKPASTPAAATDMAMVVSFAGANSATKIGDGTNNAAIKAASTAAAAADPAIVVALSPNSPMPTAAAPATYSASIVGLATAVTATDIFTITGSATKTVRVSRIMVNGVQTTAAQVNVLIVKRSTANSAGTSTAPTAVSYDTTNAAATATVLAYTANPTLGTAVGTASASRAFIPGAATASDAQGLEIVSGDVGQQMMTLRGTAQVLAVNLNATTVAGSAINVTIEWTES